MRKRYASALAVAFMAITAPVAQALPGDRAIDSSHPFRLNDRTLEPGCFSPGRGPVELDTHIDLTALSDGDIARELHVTVDDDSPINVDQVLVPSAIDGYKIYNTFENTGRSADIGPNYTAVDLFAPDSNDKDGADPISVRDVIVCVSDHGLAQNEPYVQEDKGLVSAKNRPILTPKVTAFGVSAISNLKTYKIGFGYDTTQWYKAPNYDGANTFPFHPTVTDPNAFPSPTFDEDLPKFVSLFPRADGDYDARRVNDVDKASEQWSLFGLPFGPPLANDNQSFLFGEKGDLTAWTDDPTSRSLVFDGRNLITTLTQGDLPMKWTLRPSLAAPSSKRSVTFTLADYFAWNKAWQDYYKGGTLPKLALAPGTNSPDPDPSITVIVNPQLTVPPATPANPTPTPVPIAPLASNTAPVTVGGVTPSGGTAISNAVAGANRCTSTRVIKFSWAKGTKKGTLRYWNKRTTGRMSNGRLRATADFRGYTATHGDVLKVTQIGVRKNGRVVILQRVFKAC